MDKNQDPGLTSRIRNTAVMLYSTAGLQGEKNHRLEYDRGGGRGGTSMFSGGIVLEAVRLSSTAPATMESRARSASSSPVRCCLETETKRGQERNNIHHVMLTRALKLLFYIFQYFK